MPVWKFEMEFMELPHVVIFMGKVLNETDIKCGQRYICLCWPTHVYVNVGPGYCRLPFDIAEMLKSLESLQINVPLV